MNVQVSTVFFYIVKNYNGMELKQNTVKQLFIILRFTCDYAQTINFQLLQNHKISKKFETRLPDHKRLVDDITGLRINPA